MHTLDHLKPLEFYDAIFIDIDDTLIQTTLTLDKCSKFPVDTTKHPHHGRWLDFSDVVENYNNPIDVPMYAGAEELLAMLWAHPAIGGAGNNFIIISAAPDIGHGRQNRINALGKWYDKIGVTFFASDAEKIVFLNRFAMKRDVIIDDKEIILRNRACDTVLANADINTQGCDLRDLVNYWGTTK